MADTSTDGAPSGSAAQQSAADHPAASAAPSAPSRAEAELVAAAEECYARFFCYPPGVAPEDCREPGPEEADAAAEQIEHEYLRGPDGKLLPAEQQAAFLSELLQLVGPEVAEMFLDRVSPGRAAYLAGARDMTAFVRQHFAAAERSGALSPKAEADLKFLAMAFVGPRVTASEMWDQMAAQTGLSVPFLKAASAARAASSTPGSAEETERHRALLAMAMAGPEVVGGGHLAAVAEKIGQPLAFLAAASEWRLHYTPGGPVPPPPLGPAAAAAGRHKRLRLPR